MQLGGQHDEKNVIDYFKNYNAFLYGNSCICR